MQDNDYTVELSSSNSLPEFTEVSHRKMDVAPLIVTVGSSDSIRLPNQIIVRGSLTETIKIPLNLEREQTKQENLIANRGALNPETSNTREG